MRTPLGVGPANFFVFLNPRSNSSAYELYVKQEHVFYFVYILGTPSKKVCNYEVICRVKLRIQMTLRYLLMSKLTQRNPSPFVRDKKVLIIVAFVYSDDSRQTHHPSSILERMEVEMNRFHNIGDIKYCVAGHVEKKIGSDF